MTGEDHDDDLSSAVVDDMDTDYNNDSYPDKEDSNIGVPHYADDILADDNPAVDQVPADVDPADAHDGNATHKDGRAENEANIDGGIDLNKEDLAATTGVAAKTIGVDGEIPGEVHSKTKLPEWRTKTMTNIIMMG
jgi:hypothetical protein